MNTMRAAVVPALGAPLEIREIPVPVPGPGQVLVRMEASGICHTDVHAARGDWPVKPRPPFVPGHEGIGTVVESVHGPHHRAIGRRVAIGWLGSACGRCRYCVSGRETLCESQTSSGYSVDGAWAEYAVVDERFAVPVPDDIPPVEAAPLTCAGVTTYAAIRNARVAPDERVGVFGIGGLGHLAVQYARLVGASVVGVDVEDAKLALATGLGADAVVDARTTDPVEAIHDLGGLDVAVALAPSPDSFGQALRSLRRGGRLVCVALPADGTLTVPIFDLVLGGLTVLGSIVGTREELAEVFDLHARGRTRVVTETRKLDDVNAAVDDLLAGRVPARLVMEF